MRLIQNRLGHVLAIVGEDPGKHPPREYPQGLEAQNHLSDPGMLNSGSIQRAHTSPYMQPTVVGYMAMRMRMATR
jgi:hypothetical protein